MKPLWPPEAEENLNCVSMARRLSSRAPALPSAKISCVHGQLRMKLPLPASIKGLVTFIVALSLMPALALMLYSGYSGVQEDIDGVGQSTLRSARNIARQQTLLVENTRVLLLALSNLSEIREKKSGPCSILFQNLLLHTPAYADVRLFDVVGNVLASGTPSGGEVPESIRLRIREAAISLQDFSVLDICRTSPRATPVINCLLPVRENGRTLSVLMLSVIIHVPADELDKLASQRIASLHILARNGNDIFSYPPENSEFSGNYQPVSAVWEQVRILPDAFGISKENADTHVAFEKLSLSNANEPDLTVLLGLSTQIIREHVYRRGLTNIFLMLGVAAFALAVTWKVCNTHLLVPVLRLLDTANRIREGEPSAHAPKNFLAEEMNLLSDSLNSMTHALAVRGNELIAARDAATAAGAVKSEFLANMSHEIRTPMNAILGMTYLARNSELSDRQRNYLDSIHEEAGKLLALINAILDFSKIEAGKVHIEAVSFSLPGMLREVLKEAEEVAQRNGVEFASILESELPTVLKGDPLHLSQALAAVLNRAVVQAGGSDITFYCGVEQDGVAGSRLVFTISRLGENAAEDIADTIFAVERADDAFVVLDSGTDLNISIARNLVLLMQGSMRTRIVPEVGASIIISIPLTMSDTDVPSAGGEEALEMLPPSEGGRSLAVGGTGASQTLAHRPVNLQNIRVLLVEDNQINQQIAEEILIGAGASVLTTSNGVEALKALEAMPGSAPYHVVLMDLQMPELDGFAATRQLRLNERFTTIPVIAMTAHSIADEWEQCQQAGMQDYISKPIDVPKFLACIDKWAHSPEAFRE